MVKPPPPSNGSGFGLVLFIGLVVFLFVIIWNAIGN